MPAEEEVGYADGASTLLEAIGIMILSDTVPSMDNMLAVGAASGGEL